MSNKTRVYLILVGILLCTSHVRAERAGDCEILFSGHLADAQRELDQADAAVDGRLGACVGTGGRLACNRGQERFAMQSVIKLLVAVAMFRQVDRGEIALDDKVTVSRSDISVGIQPLAKVLETKPEVTLDVRELIKRMLTESDSTATDVLIARLGGTREVQRILEGLELTGMRIDRTERELQTEPFGLPSSLPWRGMDDYERRIKGINPLQLEGRAEGAKDLRDTATPQGLAVMLQKIANGTILSPASARELIDMLTQTRTFANRLKAGAPHGWAVAHKTGTSRTYAGVTEVTNDVGYLVAPNGEKVIAVALLAESSAPASARAAALASVGKIAAKFYEGWSQPDLRACKAD